MESNDQKPGMDPGPDVRQSYVAEDEIDLLELIRPLWRQKALIIGITVLAVVAAVVMVLQMTPQYRIYTQIKPGIYRWDSRDNPVPYLRTPDLKALLTGGVFDNYARENGLGDKAPKIEVATDLKGEQLTAYFFWPDPAAGKKILNGFIDCLNNPSCDASGKEYSGLQTQRLALERAIKKLREKIKTAEVEKEKTGLNIEQKKEELKLVDLQSDRLQRKIARVNADVELTRKQLALLDKKIAVARQTLTGYEKSRQEIEENTSKIIALRDELLQNPPDDNLQLLLLANTVQENIAYLNTIDQRIENARKEIISCRKQKAGLVKQLENYRLSIGDLEDTIKREIPKKRSDIQKAITNLQLHLTREIPSRIELLQQQIDGVKVKIKNLSLLEVVVPAQASIKPEKPKKKKIVALAGIMGLFLAIIIAYLRHFWLAHKDEL